MKKARVNEEPLGPGITDEVGVSGLRHHGGILDEEWHKLLRGRRKNKVFREMADNEVIIGGTLYAIEMLLRQTKWRVEPADDSPEAGRAKELVETAIEDVGLGQGGWGMVQSELLTMMTFGWSWLEKVYKFRRGMSTGADMLRSKENDGMIGWGKLPLRAQESLFRWHLGPHGEILGWEQHPETGGVRASIDIMRPKGLHFRLRAHKNNPEGYSPLRPLFLSYYNAKSMRNTEAIGTYRNLAGVPDMQLPQSLMAPNANAAAKAERRRWEQFVRRLYHGEMAGIVRPTEDMPDGSATGYKLQFLSSSGRGSNDTDVPIKRYESRMAMGLMSQFLLLGQDKVGSYSLSSDQTDLFATGLGTVLDVRDEQFNCEAIPELVLINGFPVELAPTIEHEDIEKEDIAKLSAALSSMTSSGVIVPDDELDAWAREKIGAPPPDANSARVRDGSGFGDAELEVAQDQALHMPVGAQEAVQQNIAEMNGNGKPLDEAIVAAMQMARERM